MSVPVMEVWQEQNGGRGERQNMVKNGKKGGGLAASKRASIYINP